MLKRNSDKARNDKISNTLKGHKVTEETREKIRNKLKGRPGKGSARDHYWVNNTEKECMILRKDLEKFLKENPHYRKGRLKKPFGRK